MARARAYYEQGPAEWAALKERIDAAGDKARILLKGATIVTMDPAIGISTRAICSSRAAESQRLAGPRRPGGRRRRDRHRGRRHDSRQASSTAIATAGRTSSAASPTWTSPTM